MIEQINRLRRIQHETDNETLAGELLEIIERLEQYESNIVASQATAVDTAVEEAKQFQGSVREIARNIGSKHGVEWNYEWPLLANVQNTMDALDVKKTEAEDNAAAIRAILERIVEIATNPDRAMSDELAHTLTYLTHVAQLGLESATGAAVRKDIREIETMCKQFEEQSGRSSGVYYNRRDYTLPKRVRALVDHYNRTAADAISRTKSIQDEMTTWLGALRIVAEMVGNGGTHAEKNARLRGLTEVIESALSKMQEKRVQAGYDWYDWSDVFKGDYPVREYIQSIHKLEDEIKQLKKSSNGHEQPEQQEQDEG